MKKNFFIVLSFLVSCSDEEKSPSLLSISPSKGDFGDEVTLTGEFSPAWRDVTVTFSGTPAELRSVTMNQIVAIVPMNIASGKIVVTLREKQVTSDQDFIVTCGQWSAITSPPVTGTSDNAGIFVTQGKAFVLFGQRSLNGTPEDASFYVFDPADNSWTPKTMYDKDASLAHHAFWGSDSGKGFVLEPSGGKLHVYDVATDTWSVNENAFPPAANDFYPIVAFNIGDDGYVMLSDNGLWKYHQAENTWEEKGKPTGYFDLKLNFAITGVAFGGKGYISNWLVLWEYDPATNQWSAHTSLLSTIRYTFATTHHLYIGDYYDEQFLWEYEAAQYWTRKASPMGYPRTKTLQFGIGDKAYIGLGFEEGRTKLPNDFYEYTPFSDP